MPRDETKAEMLQRLMKLGTERRIITNAILTVSENLMKEGVTAVEIQGILEGVSV